MAKKKSIYAEQCPEGRAEASGLPHNSNAIPLSPVQSRSAEDTITESPSSKTMPAVEHREFTNDGIIEEKTDKDEFVVVETVPENNSFRAELSIVGMTCMACVSCITRAVEELPFVQSFDVSLLTNSATVSFEGRHHAEAIVQTIEDAGFDCT